MRTRRIIFLLLWILSLVAISFFGGAVSYGFFFGLSLLPAVSLLYLLYVHERFRIYQEIGCREVVCGQQMPYLFVLQNGDYCAFTSVSVRLFPQLSYVDRIPDDMEFELLPKERCTFETNLVCRYRGEYEVGVKEVVITDFLRLFSLRYKLPSTIKALVLPRVIHISSVNGIPELISLARRDAMFLESEPDVTVRDYVAGDALKQIHWKATAREQKLKTRNRIGEEKRSISIFMDTRRYMLHPYEYLPLENQMLEVVLALGIFFAERQMPFSLHWEQNGIQTKQVDGITQYEELYRQMSRVIFREDSDVGNMLEQLTERGELVCSKLVIGVLHEMDDVTAGWVEQLTSCGVTVVLYLVTDENAGDFLRQGSIRQRMIVVPTEAELEGVL